MIQISRHIDLTGNKYGKLKCIKKVGTNKHKVALWLCECDCGNEVVVISQSLKNGNTKSCGCLQKEVARKSTIERNSKHGLSKRNMSLSGVYKSWAGMKSRCLNPKDKNFKNYGGRGISICDEWMEFTNFYEWAIKNGYKKGLSIERKNVNGNYEPDNCKWATRLEQGNNKRNNKFLTINGETKTQSQWARDFGIKRSTLDSRLRSGWDLEKAITHPVRKITKKSSRGKVIE